MKSLLLIILIASSPGWSHFTKRTPLAASKTSAIAQPAQLTAGSVSVTGQTNGPTPFIKFVQLSISPPDALLTIKFTITPKPGSVTRPVSVVYTKEYLLSRGYLNTNAGTANFPVFGLYAGFNNTVTLDFGFVDGSSQQASAMMLTGPFTGGCGQGTPTIVQARTNSTALSYDYIALKVACGTNSPLIIDTDGALRWAGTAGAGFATMFFDNAFYIGTKATGATDITQLSREDFDGTFGVVHDYANIGVKNSAHHNYDPGKYGMLMEVDTTTQTESVVLEVDACGNVLKRWDLADIISAAMTLGGDDPTQFVKSGTNDWFHNNACAYRASDDSLIVSSRENFVIALDYDTGLIKWILGDTTKHWYQFQSLRNFALTLTAGGLPPIGEHAVSITRDDNLLCFDNGKNSLNHPSAPGISRTYSAPRKYHIDTQAHTATEVWNYPNGQTLFSQFCSSVYEDAPLNYLVNYANAGTSPNNFAEILGLDAAGNKIFDYRYTTMGCNTSWNSIPIHLENLVFKGPNPHDPPGNWQVASVLLDGSSAVVNFRALANTTYRVEYKNSFSDTMWQTVGDITAVCTDTARITDSTASGNARRFYRARVL